MKIEELIEALEIFGVSLNEESLNTSDFANGIKVGINFSLTIMKQISKPEKSQTINSETDFLRDYMKWKEEMYLIYMDWKLNPSKLPSINWFEKPASHQSDNK